MKAKFLFSFLIFSVLFLSNTFNASGNDGSGNDLYSSKSLIIKFKPNSEILALTRNSVPKNYHDNLPAASNKLNKIPALKNFLQENYIISIKAVKPDATLEQLPGGIERIFIIEISTGRNAEEIRAMLSGNNEIEYAEFDYYGTAGGYKSSVIPNDASFSSQWGLRNTGQNVNGFNGVPGGDINAVNAWDVTTGSTGLKVSILDTGIPLAHPEFAGRLLQGYDFANNDNNPTDDQGHGTNVAGITGAKGNNGSLVAGVNWNCKIIPVKILDATGSGLYSWWVSGITYAVDNGAKVLNMSVGGSSFSQSLADAVTYAYSSGRIVVACMMNNNNNVTYYPAGFTNLISVGAINNRMQRAVPFCWGGGSSFGSHIDFCAPGEMILGLVYNNLGSTSYWCGTSQATPMIAGIISLLLSVDSSLSYTQIYNILKASARDQIGPPGEDTPGFDNYFGWGLIDARVALNQINGITPISTEIPASFNLEQNYPNPFNPVTKIKFDISKSGFTKLYVYDIIGREISILVSEDLIVGKYEVDWNASAYPSGTYFYKLESGNFSEVKKMILVK